MSYLTFCLKNLKRRKVRATLTVLGVAVATMALFSVLSFDRGFKRALREEMKRSGAHLYVSTEGCPLEAASLILHGGEIPKFLPQEILPQVKEVPGVHAAAGMLIFGMPNPSIGNRVDLFYGVSEDMTTLRPYWKIIGKFPQADDEILLGAEVAKVERREVGDKIYFEQLDKEFTVTGILERTGTQDDGFFFLNIATAQRLFHKPNRLTAVAVGLEDLSKLSEVERIIKDRFPDVYVVTERQMTGEIEKFVGGSKSLIASVTLVVILVSLLGLLNTVLMSVFEMTKEFGYMRCVGATRLNIIRIVTLESALLSAAGGISGALLGLVLSSSVERLLRAFLPYSPAGGILSYEPQVFLIAIATVFGLGILSSLYPALKAASVPPIEAIRVG